MPPRFLRLRVFLAATLLAASAGAVAEGEEGDYRLGRGYPVGSTGLRLGGYASLHVKLRRTEPWRFAVGDLSLLLSWDRGGRLRFFSELEVGDALTGGEDRSFGPQDAHFEMERLYVDTLIDDRLTVRFGKFLTPVGRWNLIHADPLVWTATRPLATESLFSKHGTGLMLHGSLPLAERRLDYALYADLARSLDPYLLENPFANALGVHLLYSPKDNLELGLSFADFELRDDPRRRHRLIGVEGFWSRHQYEWTSEWVYRASESGPDAWQGFVQGVVPVAGHWYAVGRYEAFGESGREAGHLGVLGVAYRPMPPLVWKLEYRLGTRNETLAPDGLYASFAVLF
jgi:hypothetical protein